MHKDNVEEALKAVTIEYETKLQMLEQQKNEFKELLKQAIERPQIIERLITVGRDYLEHVENSDMITGESLKGE